MDRHRIKRKIFIETVLILGLCVALGNCYGKPDQISGRDVGSGLADFPAAPKSDPDAGTLGQISWSKSELEYIEKLRSSGGLRIVTRERESVFEPNKGGPGIHGGMEFLLAVDLAETLAVDLHWDTVQSFSEYFTINGQALDDDMIEGLEAGRYAPVIPDLLKDHHVYVDGFSRRPWREKIVRFIPVTPDRDVVIVREDSTIQSTDDLAGAIVAVVRGSSYRDLLEELDEDLVLGLRWLDVEDTSGLAVAVSEGEADAAGIGGISSMFEFRNHSDLRIAFPLGGETVWSNWIVSKDDITLDAILQKYIAAAKSNGTYQALWKDQFDFPYEDYLKAIGLF